MIFGQARKRLQSALAATAVGIVVAALAVGTASKDETPTRVDPTTPVLPVFHERWNYDRPTGWNVQSFRKRCVRDGEGVLITNTSVKLYRPQDRIREGKPPYCSGAWDLDEVPSTFVAVEIGWWNAPPFRVDEKDSEFPLSLSDARVYRDEATPARLKRLWFPLVVDGDPGYRVIVWIGDDASATDRATAERLIRSLRPKR